jgi:acetyl esterase/lipase
VVSALAQRLGARALRALPGRWVAPLAGAPTVIRGRTLDPHFALIARASRVPALHTLSPAEARSVTSDSLAPAAAPLWPLERLEAHRVPGAEGPLPARLYVPHDLDGPRPLVLYFHQGGFVVGDLDWCEPFCSLIAARARCLVLSIDYRMGPEHRFPAAQEDAWAVYRFALEHAGRFGGDPARVGVGGDSAGGGLAAMIAQRARAEGVRAPRFQLLIYPWLLACADNAAYRDFAACPPLVREDIPWFLVHYLSGERERGDVRLSPGLASDLAGLAPALVYSAGFDILCDEAEEYAQRLRAAGVPVSFRCFESLPHGFTSFAGIAPAAVHALGEIARDVDLALSRGAA